MKKWICGMFAAILTLLLATPVQASLPDGTGMIKSLSIDPAVVDPDDAEFLQSLVLKAVQDALTGAKNMAEAEMRKVTGGLGFPM